MRRNPTEAEQKLWLLLKDRRFAGYKFRRQVPIGPFIADFVCYTARLIIELDGSQHMDDAYDGARDDWFAAKGFSTLRVWNSGLTDHPDSVADAVWNKLEEAAAHAQQ
jgi:very-short-patch-repair endonuclease